jgi:phosphocarrier protein HPr
MMINKRIKIKNPQGLHARPASIFVKIANKYESEIAVKRRKLSVNGKSIMGLMMLAANQGSSITIEIEGNDAKAAMRELEAFLNRTDDCSDSGSLT